MESRGSLPATSISADVAPDIAALFDRPGPFVTVYLGTEPDIEQAAQRSLARWRNLRRELDGAGAPQSALDAIEGLVADAHRSGRTLAVVADGDGVALARGELDPVSTDWAHWGALPAVGPILEWQQSSPTHYVVLCDRVGADIALFTAEGRGGGVLSVGGTDTGDPHLRKSQPGGWSQQRFQERAENSWEANMKAVVARLAKLAQVAPPRLVIVAGDVRAVQLLRKAMPSELQTITEEIEGQRAVDGGLDDISHGAVKMVASAVAEDTVAILERFREERGQADRAADGIEPTLTALSASRVDLLLVHDDPSDRRECWYAADAPLAATTPDTLTDQGAKSPQKGRLIDVAIRTAFATGAHIRVVPSTAATDGLGAILRY